MKNIKGVKHALNSYDYVTIDENSEGAETFADWYGYEALVIYKDNNDLLLNYELSSIKEFKYDMMVKRLHNTNVMQLLKNTTEVIISGKMVYYK